MCGGFVRIGGGFVRNKFLTPETKGADVEYGEEVRRGEARRV